MSFAYYYDLDQELQLDYDLIKKEPFEYFECKSVLLRCTLEINMDDAYKNKKYRRDIDTWQNTKVPLQLVLRFFHELSQI